jgi:DNA gyrase/topoisomerase IV subunit A
MRVPRRLAPRGIPATNLSTEKNMINRTSKSTGFAALMLTGAVGMLLSFATMAQTTEQKVALTGASEVPAVASAATGTATVDVKPDRSVKVLVVVTGMTATASHIHEAAAGANGPVIVPFTKTGDNTFASADGAKLTDAQYESYKAGKLYVNVHSAANPGGEVRGQIAGK